VPRYAVLTSFLLPTGFNVAFAPGDSRGMYGKALLSSRQLSLEADQRSEARIVASREKPSGTENGFGILSMDQYRSVASIHGLIDNIEVEGTLVEKPQAPERPLILCKTVDKHTVQVGEIVTFTLRYTNQGGQPITGVAVCDSLTGRLEYVSGSAKTDRAAVFTAQPNDAGSLFLRWEISGKLLPGESGMITFQARVR
jgi:uncharacterized repeat protein (TIGR01451 family)